MFYLINNQPCKFPFRFKYKDDYEKFKLALSAIAMGLSVTNLIANLRQIQRCMLIEIVLNTYPSFQLSIQDLGFSFCFPYGVVLLYLDHPRINIAGKRFSNQRVVESSSFHFNGTIRCFTHVARLHHVSPISSPTHVVLRLHQ